MRSQSDLYSFRHLQSTLFAVVVAAILLTKRLTFAQGSFFDFSICACTPSTYDFQLDVSQGCPTTEAIDLVLEAGVESVECEVTATNSTTVTDLVPISIESITVEELRQDNTVAVSQSVQGDFRDGDAFRYISISSDLEDIRGAIDLPKILQFNLTGKNIDGDRVSNIVVIVFTNDCEAYPVIRAGHSAGWIRFLEPLPPNPEICSALSPPSPAPSMIPSDFPSLMPSFQPSSEETPTAVDSSGVNTVCNVCSHPDECIQSPNDLYPDVNNTAMQVTCGQVEQFALFSNALTPQECNSLKSNAESGFCGGCGTENCRSLDGVTYAAPVVSTPSPSNSPSDIPSSTPTTSFPSFSPTMRPTTMLPSVVPSDVPSQVPTLFPSIRPTTMSPSVVPSDVPSQVPTLFPSIPVRNAGPLSPLYDMPKEWTNSTEVIVSCSLCPVGCAQEPDEIFPHMEEGMEVSCGTVEEFAFSSGIAVSYCTLLKTYLFLGSCGGCGSENC